jgi:hypothetical protein
MFPNIFILEDNSKEINSIFAGQLVCNVALLNHKHDQFTFSWYTYSEICVSLT